MYYLLASKLAVRSEVRYLLALQLEVRLEVRRQEPQTHKPTVTFYIISLGFPENVSLDFQNGEMLYSLLALQLEA